MSILKNKQFIDIIMVLFSLLKHANTRRNGWIKKIMGNFSENIRNNWTVFIRQQTGLIRQRTGLSCRQIRPVSQLIKPVHLVLIFFFHFSFFLNCLLFVSRQSYTAYKTANSEILCWFTKLSIFFFFIFWD